MDIQVAKVSNNEIDILKNLMELYCYVKSVFQQ